MQKKIISLISAILLSAMALSGIAAYAAADLPKTAAAPADAGETQAKSADAGTAPETGAAEKPAAENPDPAADFTFTISFIGDCVLSESPNYKTGFHNTVAEKGYEYFFEKVKPIFDGDDYTFANLECVLTDVQTKQREKTGVAYWFLGPAAYINILTCGGIDGVSVCNNHSYDYLGYNERGIADSNFAHDNMRKNLREAGLGVATYEEALFIEKNGFRVAIVSDGMWNPGQSRLLANRVKAAKKDADYVVAFWHGGIEYYHNPDLAYSDNKLVDDTWKTEGAKLLVDAGADLVIGGHPHVLQPMETYKGTTIIYSLGNFCYGGNDYPENATVIFQPELRISAEGVLVEQTINLIPCYVCAPEEGKAKDRNNFRPEPMTDEAAMRKVIDFLWGKTNCPSQKPIHR